MNLRIRELALQAGVPSLWTVGTDQQGNQILEKFAELIVRECVRYFNEDYVRNFDTLWREDLSKGMKQHFGVEA